MLVEFSIYWKSRLFLVLIGALWMVRLSPSRVAVTIPLTLLDLLIWGSCAMQLAQWLRLEAIWEPGSHIMPERVTSWGSGGWMCRVYLCISLGALQPLFLLTAMLLCQQSIRQAHHKSHT